MSNFKQKYQKYKTKYINMKNQSGGNINFPLNPNPRDDGNGDQTVKKHLALLELLDYEGANKQNWDIIRKIYDENVVMIMSDGMELKGLEQNIVMMKQMYDMAPDCKVIHDIQFGSGDWLAVGLTMTGTMTGPMKTPEGKVYQPTGKKFKMKSCSLEQWRNDKIIKEIIYWDNGTFMKQLGLINF